VARLFERYAKTGDNATLKAWASPTPPTLKHRLEMAEAPSKNNSARQ
jgi:putative membrane protein